MREIAGRISNGKIVLPVIQRRLVWEDDKMESLFDSLFKQSSFGSMICIEEESGLELLFAHRLFTRDGNNTSSVEAETMEETLLFVIYRWTAETSEFLYRPLRNIRRKDYVLRFVQRL